MEQQSAAPTRKVTTGAIAGSIAGILVWIMNTFVLTPDKQIPAEIGMAISVILTFAASYFMPPAPDDQVQRTS